MSGWGPSWQPHGTRDSGSSWKPRAWWDQEPSLFTTNEWHWVPVSGHDEPGDHRARSQSHNCFTESIPLNSPLGKLLLFPFLMRFSWQSLTPVSQADLNTYLFGAYFIKGKKERTRGEIGRRWIGADEAHAFTFRRRAFLWGVIDTKLAIYFKKPVCWADQQGGQACGPRGSLSTYFASPSTMLSWPQRPFSRAVSSNLPPGSTASICTVTTALYLMLVFVIYWLLNWSRSVVSDFVIP